jgi:anaerobic ribonucleoside-triphosphate reductase
MSNHATREELNRAYRTFERSIDKLSQVLDKHAEKQTQAYAALDQKIKEQAQESKIKALELESRLKVLENEKLIQKTQRDLIITVITRFPKTTLFLMLLSLGGIVKVIEDVSKERTPTSINLQSNETSVIKSVAKAPTKEIT